MPFKFNAEQETLVNEYSQLLKYGYQKISSISLNFESVRVRKRVLYYLMGAMQSYSESLLKLMGSEPVYEKPGEALLRSQFEIVLNIRYIYSTRSEKRARLFLSDLLIESIKFAKNHKNLWNKYPTWNLEFGNIKKPADWDDFISKQSTSLRQYQKKNKDEFKTKLPNLKDRAIAIDKNLKSTNKLNERTSAESYYIHYYSYFSQSTHSSMPGLQRYVRNSDVSKARFLDIDSKPEDAATILKVSYATYLDILQFFLKVFNQYDGTEYKKYRDYVKKLAES